ncbi:MAG: Na+-transporting NADH:ubiquinone oxidoreductase subunit D [Bacteroidetes bacterium GWF2_43_63]|nr:MAG: Na+-transporting NADH:ubiquinone oxidoreductase subunit D [Bacteroidetes bacterium GWE2_42_42]OFY53824.1 MAG: Na+-transporting NADH:ubiquinone oxidoreductase subunit D [Bacteroidetes bacterium GWF2_43_63]HBG69780.1 Na+-transporting NADH:ubiquinone oxidoreductase subunit D [Bacteroidales bacterium]HCB61022.1 Na+-transporting NADH:ubiquinone oxidoreductase subunit D [Bacteroidales bacterium]HCY24578.1 Na+-transporting NADH:ubiquinone oxidoreductase subunit D [Bacteroidales bacterium]
MNMLTISGSPHLHARGDAGKVMRLVILAMLPALLGSFYLFGLGAVKVVLVSVLACVLIEYLIQRFLLKDKSTIGDGSAVVTGILLAFNVPSNLPVWIILIGALVAIGIGKMSFGGLGKNPFNPALVGRVFLLISFPVQMTSWPKPIESASALTDVVTGPTPLALLKESDGFTAAMAKPEMPDYLNMLLGNMGGSVGEVSALLLLIGAALLLITRVITWHIPVSYILGAVLFSGILWLYDPAYYADPVFHLITGGMMLGVFFMATDMVTSPMSPLGMLIFGFMCGFLTILIRVFGAYPEGVSFAILIMNAFVPLLNKIKPKRFGEVVNNG